MIIFDSLPKISRDRINNALFPVTMEFMAAEWNMRDRPPLVPFIEKYVHDLEEVIRVSGQGQFNEKH